MKKEQRLSDELQQFEQSLRKSVPLRAEKRFEQQLSPTPLLPAKSAPQWSMFVAGCLVGALIGGSLVGGSMLGRLNRAKDAQPSGVAVPAELALVSEQGDPEGTMKDWTNSNAMDVDALHYERPLATTAIRTTYQPLRVGGRYPVAWAHDRMEQKSFAAGSPGATFDRLNRFDNNMNRQPSDLIQSHQSPLTPRS